MDSSTFVKLSAVGGFVLANGWFVAAEYSLVSVRRTRVLELEAAGNKRAPQVRAALDDINSFISTAQVGVTMCSLAIGALGEPAFEALVHPAFAALGIPDSWIKPAAIAFAFLMITYLHVVVGELAPKSLALQRSERVALSVIRTMNVLRKVMMPLILVLDSSAVVLCRVIGVERAAGMHVIHSEEELKMLVSQSSKGGVLEDSEQEMLYNVFDFADTNVDEVMVPRPDVVAFDVATPPAELLQRIVDQPFTRYPVYRGGMDDIIGILHVRDLFNSVEKRGKDKVVVQDLLRPAHLVPQSKSLAGLLSDFRRSKSHMALVMDEYGSLTGIVTLEDLIEEIVGEIDDEHDRPEQPMERISDNHVRVDGKFPIDELNENLGLDLPTEDYHTIGGFVFGILGQQPHEGDVVRHDGIRFEVTET
ncbi:MAG: HlyC/CorC family transporter, partial [Thermoleophilia bacterium]|nr:HlyC/CorC family transporter [Thermoleophilia bacterium]